MGPATAAITVQKASAFVPVSVELLFDWPREGFVVDGFTFVEPWPTWLIKEWLRRGNGLGRTVLSCRWPRPTVAQLREERIARNEWLRSLDEERE